ncbi:class I SAM-dependent methyltransferase [bacterium]|jgi:ubiquinone/menaquinone biosynthesis C-methylase UbiE|nr:class I SAM-dependent methyltransferase [bacterium]
MEAFYRLAAKDYQLLATSVKWTNVITDLRAQFNDQLKVLDVACGSGQFPSALQQFGGWNASNPAIGNLTIPYTLLDPSQFSIDTAKEKLQPPFSAADELRCTAQQLDHPSDPFSIVWATHALYCVPAAELDVAIKKMVTATHSSGLGFIAHASESAHYLKFHQEYLQSKFSSGSVPYCTAEEVMLTLQSQLAADQLSCHAIEYDGTVDLNDKVTVERYLQRCLFDDGLTLEQMMADEHLGPYLCNCRDESNGVWRFRQRTWMMFYGEQAKRASGWVVESSD